MSRTDRAAIFHGGRCSIKYVCMEYASRVDQVQWGPIYRQHGRDRLDQDERAALDRARQPPLLPYGAPQLGLPSSTSRQELYPYGASSPSESSQPLTGYGSAPVAYTATAAPPPTVYQSPSTPPVTITIPPLSAAAVPSGSSFVEIAVVVLFVLVICLGLLCLYLATRINNIQQMIQLMLVQQR